MKRWLFLAMILPLVITDLQASAKDTLPQYQLDEYILTEQFTEQLGYERLTEEAADIRILSFDVSDEHLIAAGYENGNICIYDRDGSFVTGFHIETNGGVYDLRWEDDLLCTYIVRGDTAVRFHPEEGLVSAAEILPSVNQYEVWHALEASETITSDGTVYRLTETFWPDTITRTLPDGTSETCVSVKPAAIKYIRNTLLLALAWLGLFGIVVLICWEPKKKSAISSPDTPA